MESTYLCTPWVHVCLLSCEAVDVLCTKHFWYSVCPWITYFTSLNFSCPVFKENNSKLHVIVSKNKMRKWVWTCYVSFKALWKCRAQQIKRLSPCYFSNIPIDSTLSFSYPAGNLSCKITPVSTKLSSYFHYIWKNIYILSKTCILFT